MGWEEMTPLEMDTVTSQDRAVSPPTSSSAQSANHPAEAGSRRTLDGKLAGFIDADDPNLLLETWKVAEDGNGTILRFLDLGGAARTVKVQVPLVDLKQVIQTDAVERDQTPLQLVSDHGFQFTINKNQIVTVRIVGTPTTLASGN
jgi:alpha-mannosidase